MTELKLNKPCPTCKATSTLHVLSPKIVCRNESCDFDVQFGCPLCDCDLEKSHFEGSGEDEKLLCPSCNRTLFTKKIMYLIENGLRVDLKQRCQTCQGPTIHRPEANLSNRCFFFPKCSGQANLFGETKESLTFLDFETTGLEIGRDSIIEIGALKIDEDGYEHTFQTFIEPLGLLDPRITEITGISDTMLEGAPSLNHGLKGLVDFIGSSKIIAHNSEFDIYWLLTASIRHQIPLKENIVICTLKWAKSCKEPRRSLGALTKKYNIGHQSAHRALADAAATKELFFVFENLNICPPQQESLKDYEEKSEKLVSKYHNYVQA